MTSRSMSGTCTVGGRREEESIYNLAGLDLSDAPTAPKVKTYKIAAPSGQPVVRMHQDSSQVGARAVALAPIAPALRPPGSRGVACDAC